MPVSLAIRGERKILLVKYEAFSHIANMSFPHI
jgi:hypothetical protein